MFSRRFFSVSRDKKDVHTMYPILSVGALLEPENRQQYIAQIRQKAGAPQETFENVYLPLISTFAAYVQSLPISENAPKILDEALASTVQALTYRHGQLLPKGGDAQDMSAQEGVWTYAVTCTALLQHSGKIITDPLILLLDKKSTILGKWEPFYGHMSPARKVKNAYPYHYTVAHWYTPQPVLTQQATLMLATQIIPAQGMAWLRKNQTVFEQVVFCLGGHNEKAGSLGQILQAANGVSEVQSPQNTHDRPVAANNATSVIATDIAPENIDIASGLDLIENNPTLPKKTQQKTTLEKPLPSDNEFLTWLRTAIATSDIAVNEIGSFVHRVAEGVFLASPTVFKAYANAKGREWPYEQKKFLKNNFHQVGPGGTNIVCYRINRGDKNDKELRGLLIENTTLVLGDQEVAVSQWLTKLP